MTAHFVEDCPACRIFGDEVERLNNHIDRLAEAGYMNSLISSLVEERRFIQASWTQHILRARERANEAQWLREAIRGKVPDDSGDGEDVP